VDIGRIKSIRLLAVVSAAAATHVFAARGRAREDPQRGERMVDMNVTRIAVTIRRVADWQLAHPAPFDPTHWTIAPLYDGLIDVSETTGDPKHLAAVVRAGQRVHWAPGKELYYADDQAVGHAWLRIYLMDPSKRGELEPFKRRFDDILARPVGEQLTFSTRPTTPGVRYTDRWTWADALYMAPPTLGRLAQATGDERYLKFMDREFMAAYDALYDPSEKLFYRDARFIGMRSPEGRKVFWSRANGWVYAGLALLLETLPPDYPTRPFYVRLFRDMSGAVVAAQQPEGLWYPSLQDPLQVPSGETSGSALFVFGLAWGVHHALLDRATYWPAVERGWRGLVARRRRSSTSRRRPTPSRRRSASRSAVTGRLSSRTCRACRWFVSWTRRTARVRTAAST
jgi:unsaturated rhamnogalacturonyl hydrolase